MSIDNREVVVTAIMAVHGRVDSTVRLLSQVRSQLAGVARVRFIIFDDGSPDDTARRLAEHSDVVLINGDGSHYWASSMRQAEARARRVGGFDYLLWLNNDVDLVDDALRRLLELGDARRVVVGCCAEPDLVTTSYGGLRRVGRSPTRLKLVSMATSAEEVDTFNGNVVLVGSHVVEGVDGIDGHYGHAYGDLDYGLRAVRAGYQVYLAPGFHAVCPRNEVVNTWRDTRLPRAKRLKLLCDRKALPPRSQLRYVSKFGGRLWPAYLAASYVRPVLTIVRGV